MPTRELTSTNAAFVMKQRDTNRRCNDPPNGPMARPTSDTQTARAVQSAHTEPVRRRFLQLLGSGIVVGVAGCTSGGSSTPKTIEDWLSETKNYTTVEDKTGTKSVTVAVGPKQTEYVFAPAAIKISSGTTVTWTWVGSGSHNVVATDGAFDSGAPVSSGTYMHTFETAGTFFYYCKPHKSMGMKGAVVVAHAANSLQPSTDRTSQVKQ